jgi:hypothetical protein
VRVPFPRPDADGAVAAEYGVALRFEPLASGQPELPRRMDGCGWGGRLAEACVPRRRQRRVRGRVIQGAPRRRRSACTARASGGPSPSPRAGADRDGERKVATGNDATASACAPIINSSQRAPSKHKLPRVRTGWEWEAAGRPFARFPLGCSVVPSLRPLRFRARTAHTVLTAVPCAPSNPYITLKVEAPDRHKHMLLFPQ